MQSDAALPLSNPAIRRALLLRPPHALDHGGWRSLIYTERDPDSSAVRARVLRSALRWPPSDFSFEKPWHDADDYHARITQRLAEADPADETHHDEAICAATRRALRADNERYPALSTAPLMSMAHKCERAATFRSPDNSTRLGLTWSPRPVRFAHPYCSHGDRRW